MAQSALPTKIIIIGGGLAGLALGQGLKQAKIPFHIFERDTSASYRAQGYRIRIDPDGAGALRRLLPAHLFDAFEATSAEVVQGGHKIDANTGEAAPIQIGGGFKGRGPPGGPPMLHGKSYNVDRAVIRNVLLSGLEDFVSFGKRLERFEHPKDGGVLAHFSDGVSERGSLLVGADGIRSVVRRQLLPDMVVLDTEGRAIFGKTPIIEELTERIPKEIGHGISLTGSNEERRLKLFCDGMRFNREQTSTFEKGLALHIPADYIYWVLLFRQDFVSTDEEDSLLCLSSEQSADLSMKLTSSWNEKVRATMEHQAVDAASTLAFHMASPDFASSWTSKPAEFEYCVTLIGDSAHPMPPVGGVGANAGFMDSADLCDELKKIGDLTIGAEGREQMIRAYERKMIDRAQPFVKMSAGGAAHFFGMKPVDELRPVTMWH